MTLGSFYITLTRRGSCTGPGVIRQHTSIHFGYIRDLYAYAFTIKLWPWR